MLANPNAPLRSARVADHVFNRELAERTARADERIEGSGYKRVTLEGGIKALVKVTP